MAIAAPRGRAHRDEDRIGAAYGFGEFGGEGQALLAHVVGDDFAKARLEDRDFAPLQGRDLARVLVDACDHMAEVGETGAGHQTHIARSDHGDMHTACSLR